MGQLIEVEAMSYGDVAVFSLDRSLTGQDARIFASAPNGDDPPRRLARRLWERPGDIESLHILSNTVTAWRPAGWDAEVLDDAKDVIANLFVHWEHLSLEEYDEQLRSANYNATVTSIREQNPDLWVMEVTPDEPIEPFEAGKYTTLGLGFWEPRADRVVDDFSDDPEQREKMARRSYSVSSSIVDENGDLVPAHTEAIEFYIVQVPPDEDGDDHPDLTPRIFDLEVGDRIYMSHKFTGRYTLEGVEPDDNVVFLSTGTGEAPQNMMVAELLRRGHEARIVSVVCVRYKRDLAYLEQQAKVQEAYPNYEYVTLTTREPENDGKKVYIQDYIESGQLEEVLGAPLSPDNTHVFLCGNPLMIGLPTWDDDGNMTFPEPRGVCEILDERGFTIDHLRERGNVHYEEYWKER